ncbi:MAG: cardiolipin synthase ClsB [Myxococcales bacterium]|nr:cardiolipin synthase ClsB [Myxococcales bacterium]
MTWFPVEPDAVRLLRDGREAFPAMLEAIAKARSEVLLEMYWVGDDECGRSFRSALVAAASRGVTVRVIVDAVGSLSLTPQFWDALVAAGGEVEVFHPLRRLMGKLDLARLDRRDHRKLLVVDGELAFCGGINLARHWLAIGDGGEGWRDDAVAVRGPVATDVRALFYETWRRVRKRGSRVRHVPRFPKEQVRAVSVVASGFRPARTIRREYLRAFARATSSIDIANSYFVPDAGVRRALFRAVARGVRVRILLPGRSDVPLVQRASEAVYEVFMKRGAELFLFPDTILHSKMAVIDDRVTIVGSYNFDARSLRKNLEANVVVRNAAFARHVRLWFEHDLASANKVELDRWQTRGLAQRATERLAFALRRLW